MRPPDVRLGAGCVGLGSASASSSPSEQVRLVETAIDAGVSLFDTADAYGSGNSERVVGRALRGRRDRVTIATKGGYVFRQRSTAEQRLRRLAVRVRGARSAPPTTTGHSGATGAYGSQDFSPTAMRSALEASLRRLGVEHIDVYQLHGPRDVPDETLAELIRARAAGKIGAIGIGAETIDSATRWARSDEAAIIQLPFGLLDPDAQDLIGPLQTAGATRRYWARGVLGGGVLAASMRRPGDLRGHPKEQLVADLTRIAVNSGIELDELAIRWVAAHPGLDTVMLGIGSPTHLRRNLDIASRPRLPADVVVAVASAQADHRRRIAELGDSVES